MHGCRIRSPPTAEYTPSGCNDLFIHLRDVKELGFSIVIVRGGDAKGGPGYGCALFCGGSVYEDGESVKLFLM